MGVINLKQEQMIQYRYIAPRGAPQPLFVRDENNWLYCILGDRDYLWTSKHKWSENW